MACMYLWDENAILQIFEEWWYEKWGWCPWSMPFFLLGVGMWLQDIDTLCCFLFVCFFCGWGVLEVEQPLYSLCLDQQVADRQRPLCRQIRKQQLLKILMESHFRVILWKTQRAPNDPMGSSIVCLIIHGQVAVRVNTVLRTNVHVQLHRRRGDTGRVKRKSALKHAQHEQIQIILRMRKVSFLLSIHTFCSIQWFYWWTVKALVRLRGFAGRTCPKLPEDICEYAGRHMRIHLKTSFFTWHDPYTTKKQYLKWVYIHFLISYDINMVSYHKEK